MTLTIQERMQSRMDKKNSFALQYNTRNYIYENNDNDVYIWKLFGRRQYDLILNTTG